MHSVDASMKGSHTKGLVELMFMFFSLSVDNYLLSFKGEGADGIVILNSFHKSISPF